MGRHFTVTTILGCTFVAVAVERARGEAVLRREFSIRRIVAIGGSVGTIALVLLGVSIVTFELPPKGADVGGYVTLYRPPRNGFEAQLDLGDGQAYAALAQDPTLARPGEYFIATKYLPPLASRPAFTYLVWATSLGQPSFLPVTFTLVEAASAGLLAAGVAALLQARRLAQDDRYAVLVVALPGALTSLRWYGPELLAVGLGSIGLALWVKRDPNRWAAAGLFALAGLCREYMLLVPVVATFHWLTVERKPFRHVAPLALAPLPYLLWTTWVSIRMGKAASETAGLLRSPANGLWVAMQSWTPLDFVIGVAALILVLVVVVRFPRDVLTWCSMAFALLAIVVNPESARSWEGFSRVFLPLYVFSLVELVPSRGGRARATVRQAI